jgi:hypothetical protein
LARSYGHLHELQKGNVGLYRNSNAEDAFDHFEEQRETNVE